ncbi:MAG: sialidase family protein [Actinomycetota bacterium]
MDRIAPPLLLVVALLVGSAPTSPTARGHSHADHSHAGVGDLSEDYLARLGSEVLIQNEADPSGRAGSGGRAVVHRPGGERIPAPDLVSKAPDPRLYRTGAPSFEPTLGVTKSGTIFFNGFVAGADHLGRPAEISPPQVLASFDDGATWKTVFQEHPFTADPYLYVDPDTSRVFTNNYGPPCHFISFSDDGGKEWSQLSPRACEINDHQTLFAGPAPKGGEKPEGYRNVVYFCGIGGGNGPASFRSMCTRSLDGGVTFSVTGEPAFVDDPSQRGDYGVPGNCNGGNGHGFVGSDGTVYLPRGWCGQPWLATSRDEGATWTRTQVADNGMPCCAEELGTEIDISSHEAGVVADGAGRIYYVWVAADRLPYLSVSRDGGKTWGKPLMIGYPGIKEALLPGIAIGKRGGIAVVYMGSDNSPWNGTEVDGSYEDARWNAYITMSTNAAATRPIFYSATINSPAHPMWIGRCGPDPIKCAWGDFFDVIVAGDGTPWAALVDLCEQEDCSRGFGEGVVGRLVGGPSL